MSGSSQDAYKPPRARRVLENGLVVLMMERRHLPTLSATFLLPAGTAAEPADLPGTAFFASQVLPMGTVKRSATVLAEEVDALGASLGTGCDYDYSSAVVTGLSRDASELLDILSEVVTTPAFETEEIERRRSQILGVIERRKDDYADVVRNRFAELVYGSHPYHRTREGKDESVSAIMRDDLISFHDRHYSPSGAILALVGDVDAEETFGRVEERFGGWEGIDAQQLEMPEIQIPSQRRVVTVEEDVSQAYIRIGNIGINRADPDYHALAVMNYILGGSGFGSRLMSRLREEKGLTYGVQSSVSVRKQPGCFIAVTQTGIATMNEALAEMISEIERFIDDGITEDELVWAKKFLTGSLPLTLETNEQLAQRLLEQEFFGLEENFWLEDLKKMQSVTIRDVQDVARRHIHPDQFAVVVLANFAEHSLEIPK